MTEQAKNILLSASTEIENIYNQGILDGITLIRNMIETQPEGTEWSAELIKETCNEFINKYTTDNNGIGKIPDVPNLVDEIPQEYTNAGMSACAYTDLMSFLNDESDNMKFEENSSDENENSELVPDILERDENFVEEMQETDYESVSFEQPEYVYSENFVNPIVAYENITGMCEHTNLNENKRVMNSDAELRGLTTIPNSENLEEVPVQLDETVIQLENGSKVKLSDCFASIVEEK